MDATTKKQIAALTAVLYVIYLIYKFRKLQKWQKQIGAICAGPKCHPLLGNLPEMVKAKGFSEELFRALHEEHGDVIRFFIGPTSCNISINNPDLVHEVYRKALHRPLETYLFLWYLGKPNLMFQRGKIVKEMRLRYGEMITDRKQLEKLHEISMQTFQSEVDKWINMSKHNAVELHSSLGPIIYDVMGQVMFDAPWMVTEEGREVYQLHKKLIHDVNRWVLWPSPGPLFHPGYIDYLLTMRKWHNLVGSIIERRAKEMRENPKKFEGKKTAISMILTSKNPDGTPFFSRERAISTMCGFLNGAFDTTHATTYWIFYFLAKYPHTQTKLNEEFSRLLSNNPNPTLEDIRKCDYLHFFLMEVMRMRATVPVNQRVNDDADLEIGGMTIPAGTNINIPNCIMFADERFFGKNPEEFRPERFMGDSPEADRARKSWVPFGEHMRMCIGQIFALVELKAIIFNAVTRSHIELENPNDEGEVMIEAGVNQPLVKGSFIFRPRDMGKMREEENLKWWMAQIDALEKIKPAAGSVAPTA